MNQGSLELFLSGKLSAKDFFNSIENEVLDYKKAHQKKGANVDVFLTPIGELFIGKTEIEKLFSAYLSNEADEWSIYYILDAILLHPEHKFENDDYFELLAECTDPVVNGRITPSRIKEILKLLDSENK